MNFEIDEGKPMVVVYKDGEIGIRLEGLYEVFINQYWNEIRFKIHNGFIEEGRLDWDDATSIVKTMDVLAHSITIPDDIVGEFAKRGYGEFYPNESNTKSKSIE